MLDGVMAARGINEQIHYDTRINSSGQMFTRPQSMYDIAIAVQEKIRQSM